MWNEKKTLPLPYRMEVFRWPTLGGKQSFFNGAIGLFWSSSVSAHLQDLVLVPVGSLLSRSYGRPLFAGLTLHEEWFRG